MLVRPPSKPDQSTGEDTPELGVPAQPRVPPLPATPPLRTGQRPPTGAHTLAQQPPNRPVTGPHPVAQLPTQPMLQSVQPAQLLQAAQAAAAQAAAQRPATGGLTRPVTGGHLRTATGPQPITPIVGPYSRPVPPHPLPATPPLAARSTPDLTATLDGPTEETTVLARTVHFPRTGQILHGPRGDYAVTKVIGEGAFGAVYECVGPFDQVYAVKMVRPANRPYTDVQAEWAKEVTRLMSLRHPNVVYIYDAFEEGHLFYLALERCDHALADMLGTPMLEGLVIELARQMLAAVQFLHDNDIVHDDLHAGNVLITEATDRPQIKISDFGISHELRGHAAVRPNVVHHAIMAPEILSTGYTSKQSDIYQVGLLLYWMVSGETAIDMSAPYDELVRVVADGEPRRKAEALGTPLAMVMAKMLRRRENFRYSSAREVWADLRELDAWRQRSLFPLR